MWFNRGGNYNNGVNAGVFNFNNNNGNANSNNAARLVFGRLQYIRFISSVKIMFKDIMSMEYRRGLIPY